jgi:hypothetical protein
MLLRFDEHNIQQIVGAESLEQLMPSSIIN